MKLFDKGSHQHRKLSDARERGGGGPASGRPSSGRGQRNAYADFAARMDQAVANSQRSHRARMEASGF